MRFLSSRLNIFFYGLTKKTRKRPQSINLGGRYALKKKNILRVSGELQNINQFFQENNLSDLRNSYTLRTRRAYVLLLSLTTGVQK